MIRAISGLSVRKAKLTGRKALCGAVTLSQRFGSALHRNLRSHMRASWAAIAALYSARCARTILEGPTDRSRRPYRHANRLPFQIEQLILRLKERHSSGGAQKIRDKIKLVHRRIALPAFSTVPWAAYRHLNLLWYPS